MEYSDEDSLIDKVTAVCADHEYDEILSVLAHIAACILLYKQNKKITHEKLSKDFTGFTDEVSSCLANVMPKGKKYKPLNPLH